jgi:hypothetical protein
MKIRSFMRLSCVMAFVAVACPFLDASAAPFFSIAGGSPYEIPGPSESPIAGFKGWSGGVLAISGPAIVTITYLGSFSGDRLLFNDINVNPVTFATFTDPPFPATILAGNPRISASFHVNLFDVGPHGGWPFGFFDPNQYPFALYINDVGPLNGSDAQLWVGNTDGKLGPKEHLGSAIFAFDDGSRGATDRTFEDMIWLATIAPENIPEPTGLSLLLVGLVGLAAARWRRA